MAKKTIEITGCCECPYVRRYRVDETLTMGQRMSNARDDQTRVSICSHDDGRGVPLRELWDIPQWCPLSDAR